MVANNVKMHSTAASGFSPDKSAAEALREARARSSAARTQAQPRLVPVAEAEQELEGAGEGVSACNICCIEVSSGQGSSFCKGFHMA